tara:strand:+ start:4270 stop:4554 length:285 start_codon:yes stop_codon:yes gene_type:complete
MISSGKTTKIIVAITLIIIIFFIYLDIFQGQFSFSNNEKINNLISEKENELEVIFQDNQDLKEEIDLLKNNEDHIKKIAEDNLGLVKDDEEEPE